MDTSENDVKFPEITKEVLQILMEAGYVAIGRGMQSAAEDIFDGVSAARPESELPVIGLAVTKMNFGDFVSASKLLYDKALAINPKSDLAKCFLGVVSFYCGAINEAASVLEGILSDSEDEAAKKIASSIMKEINEKEKGK